MRRFTWILLSQNGQVIGLDNNVLTLGFKTAGARDSFVGGGSDKILQEAAVAMIGASWKVDAIVDPSADPGAHTDPVVRRPAVESAPAPSQAAVDQAPSWAQENAQENAPERAPGGRPDRPQADPVKIAEARQNISGIRAAGQPAAPTGPDPDADAHPDDPDADDSGLAGAELLERELGATVIDEIPND